MTDRALEVAQRFGPPRTAGERRPVHVVYGGADRFNRGTVSKLGELALRAMQTDAPSPTDLVESCGVGEEIAEEVWRRTAHKLATDPVEDFRIDFEDGFGYRSNQEEDAEAVRTGVEAAAALNDPSLSYRLGIRVKALDRDYGERCLRTLELHLRSLADALGGAPRSRYIVTLPKVEHEDQVFAFVDVIERIESESGFDASSIGVEVMIETPGSLFDESGGLQIARIARAAGERLIGAHFGAYDYLSLMGISGVDQTLDHPACDVARALMQAALSPMGIELSDGVTNEMPIGPIRSPNSDDERSRNRKVVHRAWRVHAENVRRSIRMGFMQSWDLHPAQLVPRYAVVAAYYLEHLPSVTERLARFIDGFTQATRKGTVFDDAATANGLVNFFRRGWESGMLTRAEVEASGLEVGRWSFHNLSADE